MSYLALFSITPIGSGESVSKEVAKAFRVVKESGVDCQLTSMGTIIETESIEQIMDILQKAIKEVEKDHNRVNVIIKLDCRKGKSGRIASKVNSVLEKL
ncbi:MAG: MTH1187 family thiamine-binding protein [Candidatus Calescibacterium sp.]|nr:MTH1187 family thiamine-binding protein [Candidatus Calescibacterium sp.]MCX7971681.1 MTH1187 family thiamine-binding protein [bacterium]MDW8195287.1 MTH1187 family thiamine-binding protein [Candidatus Calescibacterium sp.]